MIVEAVVEDPRGATERHWLDQKTGIWRAAPHPRTRRPWPASYGFLAGTHNPVDQDALDTLILATPALPTGTCLAVRPIGLLARPDGDHKVIAVARDDALYGDLQWLHEAPTQDLNAIEAWFRLWTDPGRWFDAGVACHLINRLQAINPCGAVSYERA